MLATRPVLEKLAAVALPATAPLISTSYPVAPVTAVQLAAKLEAVGITATGPTAAGVVNLLTATLQALALSALNARTLYVWEVLGVRPLCV
ncbi:hypothetical protein D3C75_1079490 [compost metagenome]